MQIEKIPITQENLNVIGCPEMPENVIYLIIGDTKYINTLYQEDEKGELK